MDRRSVLDVLERVLDASKVALLATVGEDGRPNVRWMTPTLVRGRERAVYAVTSPNFAKARQVAANPNVEWMVQTKSLDEIINVRGEMMIVDNPAAKAEVLEAIGGRLGTFWKLNRDESSLVVLETRIDSIVHFNPLTGERQTFDLGENDG
jgi:pyridoxamine 5'-phosphate oxidase